MLVTLIGGSAFIRVAVTIMKFMKYLGRTTGCLALGDAACLRLMVLSGCLSLSIGACLEWSSGANELQTRAQIH